MITDVQRNSLIDMMMAAAGAAPDIFAERFNACAVAGTPRYSAILAARSDQRAYALQDAAHYAIDGKFYMALLAEMNRLSPRRMDPRKDIAPDVARELAGAEHHAVFDPGGLWDIAWIDALAKVGPSIGVVRIPNLANPYVGTGILVGSRLLLTAAHVVKNLIDFNTNPPSAVNGGVRAQVEFHHPNVIDSLHRPVISRFDNDWLKTCSPPCGTPPHLDANDEALARSNLDFALIKLDTPVGKVIGALSMDAPSAANDNSLIAIIGHLGGSQLRFHLGRLITHHKQTRRLHHQANAANGMSGGPCIDITGAVIAIHEGATPTYNRSVYLRDIRAAISMVNPDPLTDELNYAAWLPRTLSADPLAALGLSPDAADRHPLIGRRPYQDWMHSASSATNPQRLALISGPDASGKSFSAAIMNSHVDSRGDFFVSVTPEIARRSDIAALLDRMDTRIAQSRSSTGLQGFRPDAGMLRHEIIPNGLGNVEQMLKAIETRATMPLFWLTVDFGDDQGWISGDQDAWKSFLGGALRKTWLRIAVLGISAGRQAEFRALFSQTAEIYCETLTAPSWPEIQEFASNMIGTTMAPEEKATSLDRMRGFWERKTANSTPIGRMRETVDLLQFLYTKTAKEG